MIAADYLFVYGTLMRNGKSCPHPFFDGQAGFVDTATMPGMLYNVENYPGAVFNSNGKERVHGEIYRLYNPERLLQTLDEYEECTGHIPLPHEYRRCKLPVLLADGLVVSAWVYLYDRPVSKLLKISGGDYRTYLQNQSHP